MCRSVPVVVLSLVCVLTAWRPAPAAACGGLFCSGGGGPTTTGGVVNQTAERIVFVHNDDQTVTAVIQILYEGDADKFAWIIPIKGVPEVAVSSTAVLDALQTQTNPLYQSTIQRICPPSSSSGGGPSPSCGCGVCGASAPTASPNAGQMAPQGGPVVTVEAAGSIGPYDYSVISVDAGLFDPSEVALEWLTANDFDASASAADALRPYLLEGLNLLAFKLQKDADVGSIRPVMLTYDAQQASIPIRPTAVAAQDDMSVLVWVLGQTRAVPLNYKDVVLNDARIDWLMPGRNYDSVVSAAVDEAGGQAFVTELASPWQGLQAFTNLEADFTAYRNALHTDWVEAVSTALLKWEDLEGFDEALQAAATLPPSTGIAELKTCVRSVAPGGTGVNDLQTCLSATAGDDVAMIRVDIDELIAGLDEKAIAPVLATVERLGSMPHVTRLYTKLSPQEMTLDPVFAENPAQPLVSNSHVVQGTSDCGFTMATLQLPNNVRVMVNPSGGTWPVDEDESPAALQVLQYGTTGAPVVVLDQTSMVSGKMFGVSQCAGGLPGTSTAGRGGSSGGRAGSSATANGTGGTGGFAGGAAGPGWISDGTTDPETESGGCSALPGTRAADAASHWLFASLFALAALSWRRRARAIRGELR
ncbi:MAG TPA: DUF2330 domain-containing protein [Polyangiales bacterium]|nr:DUF2330 domain-containing protein [Polyangiales bacterium]